MAHRADTTPAAIEPGKALSGAGDQCMAITAARDLLARPVEVPASSQELLEVLGDYRRMLFALTATECRAAASV